jgi:hypothetical protein
LAREGWISLWDFMLLIEGRQKRWNPSRGEDLGNKGLSAAGGMSQ